jgi:hypothetical protein
VLASIARSTVAVHELGTVAHVADVSSESTMDTIPAVVFGTAAVGTALDTVPTSGVGDGRSDPAPVTTM